MYKKKIKINFDVYKQRQITEKLQKNKLLLKTLMCMQRCFLNNNNYVLLSYQKQININGFRKPRNFCYVTQNSRSVYRNFRMARHALHKKGQLGLFIGVSKASW